LNPHALAGTRF